MSATADGSDGKADTESGGSSSYAMLPSDRKAVAVTRISADNSKNQITEVQKGFTRKSSLGLWWDAKGIFRSSNVADVTAHMEKHRQFYEGVVLFTVMVEKGDAKSYESLLNLYEELSEMEMEAHCDLKNSKSKAICKMLRNFLDEKYKLDHNLKKVECVVLKQKIGEVEQTCQRSREEMKRLGDDMNKLLEKNKDIEACVKESNDRAKKFQAENQLLEERRSREKEEFKKVMEDLSSNANKRFEALQREQDEKLKEVIEETERKAEERFQRQIQILSQMLAEALRSNAK